MLTAGLSAVVFLRCIELLALSKRVYIYISGERERHIKCPARLLIQQQKRLDTITRYLHADYIDWSLTFHHQPQAPTQSLRQATT